MATGTRRANKRLQRREQENERQDQHEKRRNRHDAKEADRTEESEQETARTRGRGRTVEGAGDEADEKGAAVRKEVVDAALEDEVEAARDGALEGRLQPALVGVAPVGPRQKGALVLDRQIERPVPRVLGG